MKKKSLLAMLAVLVCTLLLAACTQSGGATYRVTLPDVEGGRIEASTTQVEKGGTVDFTAVPDLGYELDWVSVNGEEVELAAGVLSFSVDGIEKDIAITAAFSKLSYSVSVQTSGHGQATASAESANYGQTVTLTLQPDTGYELDKVEIGKTGGGAVEFDYDTLQFVMPADSVSVVVTYRQIQIAQPVLTFDYDTHTVSWTAVEGAQGYVYSFDRGATTQQTADTSVSLTESALYEVWVKTVGNGTTNFDSDYAVIEADNRLPVTDPVLSVIDNKTDAFVIEWEPVTGAAGYKYMFVRGEEEDEEWQETTTPQITFAYTDFPCEFVVRVYAVGDDTHLDSGIAEEEFAVTAPALTEEYPDKMVPYSGDTVSYELQIPAFTENTVGEITLTKYHTIPYYDVNYAAGKTAGNVDTSYNANGFASGVYAGQLTDGLTVTLEKESGYLLRYELSNHFGLEAVVEQWIVVQNDDKIHLLDEGYYPDLFSGANFNGNHHFEVVENPGYELLGDGDVLRLKSDGTTAYANGTFSNPVPLGSGTKLSFWVYNNSDYAAPFALNGNMYVLVGPKSYFYWNLADVDSAAAQNCYTPDGLLGKNTEWYDVPIIEIDVRDGQKLQPYELYIGGFEIESTAFDLAAPQLSVEGTQVVWGAVKNAAGYEISLDGSNWSTTVTECAYTPADTGTIVTVYVRAVGASPFKASAAVSAEVDFRDKTSAPSDLTATKGESDYTIAWTASAEAESYKYRVLGVDGKPVTDWLTATQTSATIDSSVYGTQAGTVTVQVVACKAGNADSDPVQTQITFEAPVFDSVPKNMLVQLGADTGTLYIGGAGAIRTDLATSADGTVGWTMALKYAVAVATAGVFPGDVHPNTSGFTPDMTQVTLYNQFYLEIEWSVTDAYGIRGTHTQYILCPSSNPVVMEEISENYSDLYTKEGVLSGDVTCVASSDTDYVLNQKEDGVLLHVQGTDTATATLANNVFLGNSIQRMTFNLYNNSDVAIQITMSQESSSALKVAPKSYANFYFYYNNVNALYAHKVLDEATGTLNDVVFTVTAEGGGAIDVYLGELMIGEDDDLLAAPVLSAEGNVVSWAAVANADKYLVSVNDGGWTEQTSLSYTVEGSAETTVKVKAAANTFYRESAVSEIVVNEKPELAFTSIPDDMILPLDPAAGPGAGLGVLYIAPESTLDKNYTAAAEGNGTVSYVVKMLRLTNIGGAAGSLVDRADLGFPGGIHAQDEADAAVGITMYEDFIYVIEWTLSDGESTLTHSQYIYPSRYRDITEIDATLYDTVVESANLSGAESISPIMGEGNILHLYSADPIYVATGSVSLNVNIGANTHMVVLVYNNGDKDLYFNMYGTAYGGVLVVPAKSYTVFNNYSYGSALPSVHNLVDASGAMQTIYFQAYATDATPDANHSPVDCYVSHFYLSQTV